MRKGTLSRNVRIDNIVSLLKVENSLICDPKKGLNSFDLIDYEAVNKILDNKRKYSLGFLEGALNGK